MAEKMELANNPYFIGEEKSKKLTTDQLRASKFNSQFALSVFSSLVENNGENPYLSMSETHLEKILKGQMPKSGAETGLASNDFANKIRCLLAELKQPGGVETFTHTFFYRIIDRCRLGSTDYNKEEFWINFREKSDIDPKYQGKNAYFAALLCHSRNNSRPIGLNFSKFIDCLMVPDGKGGYKMSNKIDESSKEGQQITLAFSEYLKLLRENPDFLANFEYKESNDESENEPDYER